MLKREIKYQDFDGNEQTATFYFHIGKHEIVELDVEHKGGIKALFEKIIETQDDKGIVEQMKKLILLAVGERSADGQRFVKNDQIREDFKNHAAYEALFMELSTDAERASEFGIGILPPDVAKELKNDIETSVAASVPPAPPTS